MKQFIILVLLLMAASFFAGRFSKPAPPIYDNLPGTVSHDTIYVSPPPAVIIDAPASHPAPNPGAQTDTVISGGGETYTPPEPIQESIPAFLDTALVSSGSGEFLGHLQVTYFPPPKDSFDAIFNPAPRPTVILTKYVERRPRWFERRAFVFTAGVLVGIGVERALK